MPPGLLAINRDAGIFRFLEDGDADDEHNTVHFTVYRDGSIDIQAVDMSGVTIEALEYITELARARRRAAFNETA